MQNRRRRHLLRIVAWRPDQHRVVVEPGRRFRQFHSPFHAFAPHAGNQHLLRRRRLRRNPQHLARLSVIQHRRLAGRAQNHHSRQQAARVTAHVCFQFAKIDPLIRIKWRRRRGKNTFNQHGIIVEPEPPGVACQATLIHHRKQVLPPQQPEAFRTFAYNYPIPGYPE